MKPQPEADARPVNARTAAGLHPPDRDLQEFDRLRAYARRGRMPWRRIGARRQERLINEALVTRAQAGEANGKPFPLHLNRFVRAGRFQRLLFSRFVDDLRDAATFGLNRTHPRDSARRLLSTGQQFAAALMLAGLAAVFLQWPIAALIGLNVFATAYFICVIGFRLYLLFLSRASSTQAQARAGGPTADRPDQDLPTITILLPLYNDAALLPALSHAVDRLDYPAEKKDVKLLLEEDDAATIREAERLGLDKRYDMLRIPAGAPRTKPKACNYGLHLARGDLIVIYDAEDQPEADQLRKAAAAFQDADESLACAQARLNYYNARDNWLTRLFTLEYSLWFDWLLPALQRLRAPIPLGGTSNFLRTDTLIKVGGWDPYNVTEDADLGLRLARFGYRTEILDSTTFEEANCRIDNWIRQRSRWMKGYIQTWLVHMRAPGAILAHSGWTGFLSVQLFLAGNVFSALINPVLWTVFALWLIAQPPIVSTLFPGPLLWLNLFALVFGNLFFILMMAAAPIKRGWYGLCLYGFTAPFYWLLTSAAGYKAVWQTFFRLHYWEKTDHMLSDAARRKREEALENMIKPDPQS